MRKRNGRKSRSIMQLDLRKLYAAGVTTDLFRPMEAPALIEADFEVEFCEGILKTDPAHLHFEAMVLLGDAYTRKGDFEKGLQTDLHLSKIQPDNKLVRYNLACSYALTGQKDKAISSLNKAIDLGYRDLEHLRSDHDLDALKTDPRFQSILARLSSIAEEHEASSPQG